jgi:hypothetical protein
VNLALLSNLSHRREPEAMSILNRLLHLAYLLNSFAPLITATAVLITAAAAWTTFFLYHRREQNTKWTEGFRTLYAEFWKDPVIIEVRSWITNDALYNTTLAPVLIIRLTTDQWENKVTPDQNAILEKVDTFFALLVQIRYFGTRHMSLRQRRLFSKVLIGGGIQAVQKRGRVELEKYINIYWPELK